MEHRISPDQAKLIWGWFQERGGISLWRSADMSNPGQSWTCPLKDAEGNPMKKQDWRMEDQPSATITDPKEVLVEITKEVKRFRVAIRRGGCLGLTFKCTDASTLKIRRALEKAGENASYVFDYDTQECVILVPEKTIPLPEYIESLPKQGV